MFSPVRTQKESGVRRSLIPICQLVLILAGGFSASCENNLVSNPPSFRNVSLTFLYLLC